MSARPPVRTAPAVRALLAKELRVELRTLEAVPGMVLFAASVMVVFHFALDRLTVDGQLAAGLLAATLMFAAILGINRLYVADAEQGGFEAFLLAPVPRTALFISKSLALLLFLVALELVAVPAFGLLLLGPPLGPALPAIVATLALADAGIAVIGTLVGALAVRTRSRDLIGPMISLPLLIPVVIAVSRALGPRLQATPHALPAHWLTTLALYDLVFALIAYAVFEFLLED